MVETFAGIEAALAYKADGVRANPCLAVDLAMTGVGTMEECHGALVLAGVSNPDGQSEIPGEGIDLTINGHVVSLGAPNVWFDTSSALLDCAEQFEAGKGLIFAVKLTDDTEDVRMHLILLAGYFKENGGGLDSTEGRITDVLVGDSLVHDTQRVATAEIAARLERTLDWAGALFSYHVAVDPLKK